MTQPEIVAILRRLNPTRSAAEIVMYAAAFVEHAAAQRNIDENGTIVFHPRTGAPIDNPFVAVRDRAAARLLKLRLKADELWAG